MVSSFAIGHFSSGKLLAWLFARASRWSYRSLYRQPAPLSCFLLSSPSALLPLLQDAHRLDVFRTGCCISRSPVGPRPSFLSRLFLATHCLLLSNRSLFPVRPRRTCVHQTHCPHCHDYSLRGSLVVAVDPGRSQQSLSSCCFSNHSIATLVFFNDASP